MRTFRFDFDVYARTINFPPDSPRVAQGIACDSITIGAAFYPRARADEVKAHTRLRQVSHLRPSLSLSLSRFFLARRLRT